MSWHCCLVCVQQRGFRATANALRGPETDPFLVPGEWQMCLVSCLVVSALLVLMARAAKKEHRHLAEIIGFPAAGGLAMALVCSLSSDQMYHVNGWIVLVVGLIAGPVVWFDWPAIYCRFRHGSPVRAVGVGFSGARLRASSSILPPAKSHRPLNVPLTWAMKSPWLFLAWAC